MTSPTVGAERDIERCGVPGGVGGEIALEKREETDFHLHPERRELVGRGGRGDTQAVARAQMRPFAQLVPAARAAAEIP
jgi:hypothetical protein